MVSVLEDREAHSRVWAPPQLLAELSEDGERELAVELIDTFLQDSAARLRAIEEGWARDNLPAVRAQAHSLKGSCGQMGADSMAQLCQAMETMAREEKRGEGRTLASRLAAELASVGAAMENYRLSAARLPGKSLCGS